MSTDPKYDELHKQLFDEGLKMRRSVVGEAYVDRALQNGSTEFSRAGQELVTEWCCKQTRVQVIDASIARTVRFLLRISNF